MEILFVACVELGRQTRELVAHSGAETKFAYVDAVVGEESAYLGDVGEIGVVYALSLIVAVGNAVVVAVDVFSAEVERVS